MRASIRTLSQDMRRKFSSRLTAVERQFADTNRRLDDVINSNVTMQTMLKEVLTSISSSRGSGGLNPTVAGTPSVGETTSTKERPTLREGAMGPLGGSSKEWWDRLERSPDVDFVQEKVRFHRKNYEFLKSISAQPIVQQF